jgi:hypothetical protein
MSGYLHTMFGGDMRYYNGINMAVLFTMILFFLIDPFYVISMIILEMVLMNNYMMKRTASKKDKHEGENHITGQSYSGPQFIEEIIIDFVDHKMIPVFQDPDLPEKLRALPEYKDARVYVVHQKEIREMNWAEDPRTGPQITTKATAPVNTQISAGAPSTPGGPAA